ncbi:anaphase-promoting complex subunit 5-domain-containing protein [Lineolata rhizophorae]|uniref:Anaphase-promoting complex subunit 5 n=1 Tax=Lineolata rhizophorae TaxID=578093 RepID=A0A6A6NNW1_9PEZI|nr:anaphase-promoting complex subunit 5-domain-containing protein [Lineolata rhizophorae]
MVSDTDVERLLYFAVSRLERLGNRVPDAMKARIERMLDPSAPASSLLHFVRFFDAWRAGDRTSAFDHLHRYFDYTMQTPAADRTNYQYALLHTAIVQADFGCLGEAVSAIKETIATARENHDLICLNFSLAWVAHLGKAYPRQMRDAGVGGLIGGGGSERDGIMFLKAKARESQMWGLLSSSLLTEARMELANGGSVAKAIELVLQAQHLIVTWDTKENVGTSMLMMASIFSRLGSFQLFSILSSFLA